MEKDKTEKDSRDDLQGCGWSVAMALSMAAGMLAGVLLALLEHHNSVTP
jgi:hypothetical protein